MGIGVVIYGPRYCGKTSFVGASDALEVYAYPDVDWGVFKKLAFAVAAGDPVVVENVHFLTESCTKYICDKENEEHPQLAGNRKSIIYQKIKEEMRDVLFSLASKVNHIYFTADMDTKHLDSSLYKGTFMYPKFDWVLEDIMPHITQQTICMTPTYKTVKRTSKLTGETELIRKEKRIMICSARPDIYAGDSTEKLPNEFDAGTSGTEAYENYMKYMKKEQ